MKDSIGSWLELGLNSLKKSEHQLFNAFTGKTDCNVVFRNSFWEFSLTLTILKELLLNPTKPDPVLDLVGVDVSYELFWSIGIEIKHLFE